MKKIAAFLLAVLMLSTAVFAEDIILIAPNPAAKTVSLSHPYSKVFEGMGVWRRGTFSKKSPFLHKTSPKEFSCLPTTSVFS